MATVESLQFVEIDLDRHFDVCVAFRADTSVCSFGSAEPFYSQAGDGCDRYRHQLRLQIAALPASCAHAWLSDRVVGQVEMRRDPAEPTWGHVRLFYLVPDLRGQGFGTQLEEYAENLLTQAGMMFAWLRVGPNNEAAVRHYLKHGWIDRGPDSDESSHRMEKRLRRT
jgi:GNAT superfamily N-acetyltransferase